MTPSNNEAVLEAVASVLLDRAAGSRPLLVGLTGSVAAGKSTLCQALKDRLAREATVEALSTDGFLLPNEALDRQGLAMRKGFPESYDAQGLFDALARVRTGPTAFPGYSHVTYDIDPALTRIVASPDIIILEGLAFSPFADGRSLADAVDLLIYLDAAEPDLEAWFSARFMAYWRAAEHDPDSFYARFRSMSAEQADQFGRMVWTTINLPNLRDHIVRSRDRAQILLRKTAGHRLELVRNSLALPTQTAPGATT